MMSSERDDELREALRQSASMRRCLEQWVKIFEDPSAARKLHNFNDAYTDACALLGRDAKEII